MFSANLSSSILRLCSMYKLSYEAASERCELSARYFAQDRSGKDFAEHPDPGEALHRLRPDAERPSDPFLLPPTGALVSHPDARHRGALLRLRIRTPLLPRLPAMRTNHGAGVPVVLRPLWPVPGLGALSLNDLALPQKSIVASFSIAGEWELPEVRALCLPNASQWPANALPAG